MIFVKKGIKSCLILEPNSSNIKLMLLFSIFCICKHVTFLYGLNLTVMLRLLTLVNVLEEMIKICFTAVINLWSCL